MSDDAHTLIEDLQRAATWRGGSKMLRLGWILLGLLWLAESEAAERFAVASGGSTTADCTNINTPCTLLRALAVYQSSDTLSLRGGTYNISINHNNASTPIRSGTSGTPTIIRGYPGETVTLRGNHPFLIGIGSFDISYVTFRNLILDGADRSTSEGSGVSASNLSTAHHIVFEDVTVQNT